MGSLARMPNRGLTTLRQYENNGSPALGSTPATSLPVRAREAAVGFTPASQLPAENVVDIIANLLAGRADADDILVAAVDRVDSISSVPGPVMLCRLPAARTREGTSGGCGLLRRCLSLHAKLNTSP